MGLLMHLHRAARWRVVAATVLSLACLTSDAAAQTPEITFVPPLLNAGPDFATDVLANPWDFSDQLDLSPFPDELGGWTISSNTGRTIGRSAFLNGGYFAGRTLRGGGNLVSLLYRGGAALLTSANENSGVFNHKAIPTADYGKLAIAMRLSASSALNTQLGAYWTASPYGAAPEYQRGVAFRIPQAGTHIYIVDLVTGAWTDARGNPGGPTFFPIGNYPQIAWNGTQLMRGFSFRPTSDGNAEVDVAIDWVRITQRDGLGGAAMMPLTFANCASQPYSVEVWTGDSWDVIHVGTAGGGSSMTALVNYGVLAPGLWSVRVTCYPNGRNGPGFSSNPAVTTINSPPIPAVHNPDAIGGTDWATTVKGNPWDMDSLSDIARIFNVSDLGIVSDGVTNFLQATATSGDPIVELLYGGYLIDTTRFRNLTFSLALDTSFDLGAPGGSVARVVWEQQSPSGGSAVTNTRDIIVWPGLNLYTIDVGPLTVANGGLEPGSQPWPVAPARYFRIDPHESQLGVRFRLGPVSLTTHDEVILGQEFPVQYSFTDADTSGSSYQARIYMDTDRDGASRTLIDTVTFGVVPNTVLTYQLNPAARGIPDGDYFVFVEIIETRGGVTDTRGLYSSGPVHVSSTAGPQAPGSPTLVAVQTASNPVTVAWSPGSGGAPTSYTLHAGTSPGASNLLVVNLGGLRQISGNAPPGVPIYVRIVASNAVGSAVSNEISFGVGLPGRPTLNPATVSPNRTVTLSWAASAGGTPSQYVVLARYPGNPAIIAMLPVGATSLSVPGVPPGSYVVTVVAVNAIGVSAESNAILVTVP
jgi:hypothetical protein